MKKTAFVFPGQGCQYSGMGKFFIENYPIAKEVYEEASEALKFDMLKLCLEGSDDDLRKTENTQPAILTTSIAMLKVLEKENINCCMTAGLSLGEYAALVKANVMNFNDAVQIVTLRGKYMQEAVPLGTGTMVAIIGMNDENIKECLKYGNQYGVVDVANYNCPGQIVISGNIEAVKAALQKAKEIGVRRVVELSVSAPFHSKLLRPAGEKLRSDLEKIDIREPQIPIVANVDAQPIKKKEQVIPALIKQVSHPVRWQQTIEFMIDSGVERFIEIGPGSTLTQFIRKTAKKANRIIEIYNTEDIEGIYSAFC